MEPSTPPSNQCHLDPRIITHFDVDAFYVACERELRPELRNRPVAVSQYNPYGNLDDRLIEDDKRLIYDGTSGKCHPDSNGSLIAVSYEARAQNVKRNDRGNVAVKKCPELAIMQVPVKNGKADLTIYRNASQRVMTALVDAIKLSIIEIYKNTFDETNLSKTVVNELKLFKVEKASIDEIYIDLSEPVNRIFQDFQKMKRRNDNVKHNFEKETKFELFFEQFWTEGAEKQTTVGGLETSQAALAANSLSKDDIRKGSSLQTIDSLSNHEDCGSLNWWLRPISKWNHEEFGLAIGACVTHLARSKIVSKFNSVFTLSAGVSLNKLMAKLASGLKKPNRQTLINPSDKGTLQKLFYPLPIGRIRGLGGKFGDYVSSTLQISTVGELSKIPLNELFTKFPDQAHFLFEIAQGICRENVNERTRSKSVGAGKTFRGALSFSARDEKILQKWLRNLMQEVMERLKDDTDRYAKTLVVSLTFLGSNTVSQSAAISKLADINSNTNLVYNLAKKIIRIPRKDYNLIGLSVSATNFVKVIMGSNSIENALRRISTPHSKKDDSDNHMFVLKNSESKKSFAIIQKQNIYDDQKKFSNTNNDTTSLQSIIHKKERDLKTPNHQTPSNNFKSKNMNRINCVDAKIVKSQRIDSPEEHDIEYAKALQASFDRENELLSSMEKRHSSIFNIRKNNPKRKLFYQSKNQNIDVFFAKSNNKEINRFLSKKQKR